MVSFGVSIPIPVSPSERQDRDTAAKLALADKAEAELAEAKRAASAEYRALASDAQRLQERIERYRPAVVAPASSASQLPPRPTLEPGEPGHALRGEACRGRRAEKAPVAAARPGRAKAQLAFKPLEQGAAP